MKELRLESIERWDIFEIRRTARSVPDNPHREGTISADFVMGARSVTVEGFYDGEATFCVRFSPDAVGTWSYRTRSSLPDLDGLTGSFVCAPEHGNNHGPVRADGLHFRFADGTPFFPLGTTAYAWTYQEEELVQSSLESFERYGFNKIRMLAFPKEYGRPTDLFRIDRSPNVLPFLGEAGSMDFSAPNPEYFRHFEERVQQLRDRGIQADIILFHVYDTTLWGIPQGMQPDDDLHYIRYVCARLSAFRNVWWSLANEYDLFGISLPENGPLRVKQKDWNAIGELLEKVDAAAHLRSIHNWTWGPIYGDRKWMTHVSYQHPNTWSLAIRLREEYRKPVINDEYQYEGNVPNDYGNATAELCVKRHWMATMAGAYATHGEMFLWHGRENEIFWSTGGKLVGDSPQRLAYLKTLMESIPFQEMAPNHRLSDGVDFFCLSSDTRGILVYFFGPGYKDRPAFQLGQAAMTETSYELQIHDVWQCGLVGVEQHKRGAARVRRMPRWCVIVAQRVGEPAS